MDANRAMINVKHAEINHFAQSANLTIFLMNKLAMIAVHIKNIAIYNKDYARIVIAYANSALQHPITVLNALIQHICKKISA